MLEARKNKLFEKVFAIYNRNLLKRRFHSIKVCGLENLQKNEPSRPLLIYANHTSWWDGLVIFELLKNSGFENYVMMEEKQLRKLPFFRLLGAFSVNRESPRKAAKSIIYACRTLRQSPNAAIVMFPQGAILPNDLRPVKFFHGVSKILEKCAGCSYLPVGLRYEFSDNFKPEIFVEIGNVKNFEDAENFHYKKFTNDLELDLPFILENIRSCFINNRLDDFKNLL